MFDYIGVALLTIVVVSQIVRKTVRQPMPR
jgi:hypothetical protein